MPATASGAGAAAAWFLVFRVPPPLTSESEPNDDANRANHIAAGQPNAETVVRACFGASLVLGVEAA